MPRQCCRASVRAPCPACNKRKQYDDNLFFITNENSIESLDVVQEKQPNKATAKSIDAQFSDGDKSCEICDKTKNRCRKCEQILTHLKNAVRDNLDSSSDVDEDVSEEWITSSVETSTPGSADNSDIHQQVDHSRKLEKTLPKDQLGIFLMNKLQKHVDQEFNNVEKDADDLTAKKSKYSSMMEIRSSPIEDKSDDSSSVQNFIKNEFSFLNRFRTTLKLQRRELKQKGKKLKKIMKKDSKNQKHSVMQTWIKEVHQKKNHAKYHGNLDAET